MSNYSALFVDPNKTQGVFKTGRIANYRSCSSAENLRLPKGQNGVILPARDHPSLPAKLVQSRWLEIWVITSHYTNMQKRVLGQYAATLIFYLIMQLSYNLCSWDKVNSRI